MTNSKSIPCICLLLIVAASATNSSNSSAAAAATSASAATNSTPTPTPPASASAAGNATGNSTSPSPPAATDTVTVTQTYTFPSLTVGTYIGDMKSNCECAYANTVEGATPPTWCTTAANTYKTGIVMASSAAARRAAKVTFVLNVKTSIKSKSQLTTLLPTRQLTQVQPLPLVQRRSQA